MERIHILIADDIEAHRRRLERMIDSVEHLHLVASAENGYEAVAFAIKEEPDIILMDIEMEDRLAGIHAATEINKYLPETKIIMLTIHQDSNIIFAAFQTGIVDYVLKSSPQNEIIDAIESAYNGESPIRPNIAGKIREEFARIKQIETQYSQIFQIISTLTPAEMEVLKLIAAGKKRKDIAKERTVELETVKKQINSILRKFGKRSTKDVRKLMEEVDLFKSIINLD